MDTINDGQVEVKEQTIDEKIASLIGAEEFKALIEEIKLIAPQVVVHNTYDAFSFQHYLFAINDGCGLSTYLKLFAEVLSQQQLFQFNEVKAVVETKLLPPSGDKYDPFSAVFSHLKKRDPNDGKLICIDISEWMTNLSDKRFKNFLLELENHTTENIIVFRVPFVEPEILEAISKLIGDILFVRSLSFPPMKNEELIACAKCFLARLGYSADDTVWRIFEERIAEEKSDGRFYGMNTINKVVREMVYRKQLHDAHSGLNNTIIRQQDVAELSKSGKDDSLSGMEMLERMIGMEQVSASVEEIISQIELAQKHKQLEMPGLHMRFVGNPGTGKTTVARIVGKILKERGVLRNGNFFEYSGRDFCGKYIGETAPRTASMCRDAYGSVLFIDEAYSLYRGDADTRDFGREALDTLIAEMENHRNDLIVIMAGYTEEMAELMKGNIGLESRMPYLIEFPNYTREQLYQIFMNMVGSEITCCDGFAETVKAYFDKISDEILQSKSFSNARFVRNLFERTCAKAGIRKKLNQEDELTLTKEDFILASSDRALSKLLEKKTKNRIGF